VASRRLRRPAALSAFYLGFVLGVFGCSGYAVLIRGDDIFRRLTLREDLTVVGVIVVLWLLFWPLFAAARRRADRRDRTTRTGA
jgi:hypothetical protein